VSSVEREQLRDLHREDCRLGDQGEILAKAAAWFARETGTVPKESSSS